MYFAMTWVRGGGGKGRGHCPTVTKVPCKIQVEGPELKTVGERAALQVAKQYGRRPQYQAGYQNVLDLRGTTLMARPKVLPSEVSSLAPQHYCLGLGNAYLKRNEGFKRIALTLLRLSCISSPMPLFSCRIPMFVFFCLLVLLQVFCSRVRFVSFRFCIYQ